MRMSCNSNDREAVRMAVAFGSYPLIGLLQQQQQQEGEDGLGSRSQRREPREKNIKFLTPAGDNKQKQKSQKFEIPVQYPCVKL